MEIKHDDKFFSRIMSKETSMTNASSRVYYAGTSGAVPFLWETTPGTPKHPSADSSVPPLTPPPSYYSTSKATSTKRGLRSNLLSAIFPRLAPKRTHVSPSSSLSSTASSSLSSWSSDYSSPSSFMNSKHPRERHSSFSRSPVHCRVNDSYDDKLDALSPNSMLCFGAKRNACRGRCLVGNM
ncbi:hypothetical protein K2173_005011 [Erythroxylum novogranatense]|uniref:Uncharacterized protein n=1 Tax=Erythroxylum novogranatense TaxID=1862640 RepID=A0AAV8TBA4_9ROSI|nr:hypothetical protein K2173_005011 [Erythroxylum novogranatense]